MNCRPDSLPLTIMLGTSRRAMKLCHGGDWSNASLAPAHQSYRPCGRRSSRQDSDLPRRIINTTLAAPGAMLG